MAQSALDAHYQPNLTTVGQEIISILKTASERKLPSLVIGGNAVIMLGYIRNTIDFDLLVPERSRSDWLDLLREVGYRFFTESMPLRSSSHRTRPARLSISCLLSRALGKS